MVKKFILGKDVEVYNPVTVMRRIVGYTLIGWGVLTLILPTGSIFAIAIGCGLISIDSKNVFDWSKFYVLEFGRWCYRHRSWKMVKSSLKWRILRW
jgi:hypothetical protein